MPQSALKPEWLQKARQVIDIEIEALKAQRDSLAEAFQRAIHVVLQLQGRVVVVGMGKSGIIAKKIAATLASTGTPAFFVHAAEAQHGDLGMITGDDAVLMLSHSGETAEVCGLLPEVKRLGATILAITGNPDSTLGRHADIVLHVPVKQEACPLNLAPTASTTAALALGDALAVVALKERGFREEDFARVHPAGSLGRKLMKVADLMHGNGDIPMVDSTASLREAIVEMSSHRLGITGVRDAGRLSGCLTDGDLRRIMQSGHMDLTTPVAELMHKQPRTITAERLASEALRQMEEHKITVLFVQDANGETIGAIHLHDLLHAGIS
ncbi:MAG TPA: KpsF/GutQ family sugar-phosphate isomerase [Mariprofundaceae bacterium]|nr:KpsF/GutQ family sugar-phosphate isomerase [Mariprofundaceae bacterium]